MKYLIIYMSHHGTTASVARQLRDALGPGETTVIHLKEDEVPDLTGFDTILIGGSIHMGHIQKEVSSFCMNHMDVLLKKRIGLFLCYMNKEQGAAEFAAAFPEQLRNHAVAQGLFGGELLLEHMNFLERLMVKTVSGVKQSVSELDQEAIATFTKAMS